MKAKLLLLALLAQFFSLTTMAYDAEIDGIYYNFSGSNASVVSGDVPYSGSVTIPSNVSYNGKTYVVTKIGKNVFCGGSVLTVSIPESVTTIGEFAFYGCDALYSITIPESVIDIGEHAFTGTRWLENQPDGLVYAGKVAYKYKGTMPDNTTIDINEGTLAIADYAFKNCSGLTSISIPESIISIGNEAFEGTEWFESQPNGLVYAGKVAYKYKGTMPENTTIEVKEGTLAIADYAFSSCNNISSITLPEGLTTIGKSAFVSCEYLYSITIPESVTAIGKGAFDWCRRLSSIIISGSVTTIGDETFRFCSNLSSVTIPEGVTSIGNDAFYGCSKLSSVAIPESVTSIGDDAFSGCWNLSSITISKNVTNIGYRAFLNCSRLSSITIPKKLTNIGDEAFNFCGRLNSIVVEEGNSVYDSRNGCNALIETATNTLIRGCKNTTIPEDIVCIGNYAFSTCRDLATVNIPIGVTTIGNSAFSSCYDLASIAISKNVTSVGSDAFSECDLASIVVEEGNPVYDSRNGCNALIETSTNTLILGCKNTVIPESVTSIGDNAFWRCHDLASITIPENVTTIGYEAFSDCGLNSITIPKSVTYIGPRAFFACPITSVDVSDSVMTIGYEAFLNTPWFENQPDGLIYLGKIAYRYKGVMPENSSIYIKEGTIGITNSAFRDCRGLVFVYIPESVTNIDGSPFYDCRSLTSVNIPKGVTCIDDAFVNCFSLSSVRIKRKVPFAITERTFINHSDAILYVPKGYKEAYQSADYWKDFKEITECDYVDVTDQTIVVGGSTTMEINVNNLDTDLVAFQMDLTLPEGVSLDKTGCSLSSRIIDEGQELTIGKLENGAYRLTSSSFSLTPISDNDGTLLTLKLTAEEGSVGGHATISNIRFSTSNSNRLTMDDKTFDINVMYKVIYIVDGEEYKTVNVVYNAPITPETELAKEGYTFSGWSEIPEIMPAHNVEVTGNLTINKYKLTYIVDDVEYKTYEIDYATAITPEAEPTQGGHNFSGWSEIPETMPAHDVKVYGTLSHTLTYLVDGEPYKTSSVVYGSGLTLEAEPTKDGYTFGGWSELPETMPAHDVEVTGRFYLFGDVNTDEEVDVVDVVDVARFVVTTPSEKFREKLADLNFDNMVNLGDAIVLVNHIAGDQNFVKEMVTLEKNTTTSVLSLTRNAKTLALSLTNEQPYTAFQFDLYIAEDADVVQMKLNSKRQQKHQLLYNKVADGHYRVAALSTSNSTFLGTAGELLSLVIDDASDADVEISNIHFFDTKGNDYAFDTIGVDQETGVNNVNGSDNVNDNIYDLQGRKLSRLQRGVNIIGGKKVLVK
ncbi:MAG: leucine-rich repeat protein [Bacteroidaceae bacterium]|nr:leucine-rich repeat protein [Bacteroidaceae bacterium]